MAMDDIGLILQQGEGLQDSPIEEGEALALVATPAIDGGPVEVILVVHKIEGDALVLQGLDAAVLPPPTKVDVGIENVGHLVAPLLADILIQGQNDAHVRAFLGKHLGQSADHVGQAAGLDKGDAFGRGE